MGVGTHSVQRLDILYLGCSFFGNMDGRIFVGGRELEFWDINVVCTVLDVQALCCIRIPGYICFMFGEM